jgi:hypothetical protein
LQGGIVKNKKNMVGDNEILETNRMQMRLMPQIHILGWLAGWLAG